MKSFVITLLLALVVPVCASAETYSINVGEFSRLKVIEGINVDYRCNSDSAGVAFFECDDPDRASAIGLTKNGEELTVSLTSANRVYDRLPTLRVYSSFLTKVENSGDSMVRVLTVAPCPNFNVTQIGNGRIVVRDISATRVRARITTGNGTIVLFGKCDEAVLNMTGTGHLQADGLKAATVKVSAYGTGSVGCFPTGTLTVHGIGSTSIYYRGHPEVRNRAVGVKLENIR